MSVPVRNALSAKMEIGGGMQFHLVQLAQSFNPKL